VARGRSSRGELGDFQDRRREWIQRCPLIVAYHALDSVILKLTLTATCTLTIPITSICIKSLPSFITLLRDRRLARPPIKRPIRRFAISADSAAAVTLQEVRMGD